VTSSPFEPRGEEAATPWYRRRGALFAGTVAVVVAIAVITDLPTPASRSSQVATANAFVAEINTDLAPCDYSLGEAYGIRADQLKGTLPAADAGQIPSLLRDDEMACSYAGPTISDLTSIESPGTVANRPLSEMLSTAIEWSTYDALSALDDIQELFEHPGSVHHAALLVSATALLHRDRTSARASIREADGLLGSTIDQVDMVAVKVPSTR
jgi:hypothetical protein